MADANKTRQKLARQIVDIYNMAQHAGMSSTAIQALIADCRAECPKRTPQWVYSYADGVSDILRNVAYRDAIRFGGYIDDKFYTTDHKRDDYYEKQGFSIYDVTGRACNVGHYWTTTQEPRPYYISKESD